MKICLALQRLSIMFLVALIMACSAEPDEALRIGTNQWLGYEPLYLARDQGYFNNAHITLIELPSTTDVLRAFRRQQINIAAVTLDEALQLAQTEPDLRIFLVLDISNGADKVMAIAPVTTLSEIKGHCILAENTALGAFMLYHLLHAASLTKNDITVHSATVDQHLSTALSGICPVIVTFEPTASQLAEKGWQVLFSSEQIPGQIVDVLVTRQKTLKRAKHNLSILLAAHWRALNDINTHPNTAYAAIAQRLNMKTRAVASAYQGLILPDQYYNQQLFNTQALINTTQQLRQVMMDAHLLQSRPDIRKLITAELVTQDKE